MTLRLYDTLTRAKTEFVPRDPGRASMYVCGPTVYNHIHIGNARTFLSFDVIRRYLEYRGFDVDFVRNVTDVDDKIIQRAREEGLEPPEIAEKYTVAFHEAMSALGVLEPTHEPRATRMIGEMIELVESLVESGHAYEVDGDVYFSVRSFPAYGRLSGRDVDDMRSGARVDVDERKEDPLDFALWKTAKPGEPHWSSPWGEGRPGWHLECSVMSVGHLGESFDIHGGATDLIFPHHENEIAQSEAATGAQFARHWMHGGLLQVDAEKMSKSLGNFMLLKDVLAGLEGDYPAPVVRLLMLQTHYRSPLDFSLERLDEAGAAYGRLATAVRNIRWAVHQGTAAAADELGDERAALADSLDEVRSKFEGEMDDDFNTAGALGAVFELTKRANAYLSENAARLHEDDLGVLSQVADEIEDLLHVLGVKLTADGTAAPGEEEAVWAPGEAIPAGIVAGLLTLARDIAGFSGDDPGRALDTLLAARTEARSAKDWARADAVRDGLAGLGVTVEDTPQGPRPVIAAGG